MFTSPSKMSHRTAPAAPTWTVRTVNTKVEQRPVYGNLFNWSDADRVVSSDISLKSSVH